MGTYNIGADHINVKASTTVNLKEYFVIQTLDGPIDIVVNINSDFADIPEKYHEICLNMLTSKYLNKVDFGNNPFSECKPIVKRKWYQFWKSKYFQQSK
jgi:hypothetical protein